MCLVYFKEPEEADMAKERDTIYSTRYIVTGSDFFWPQIMDVYCTGSGSTTTVRDRVAFF